MGLCQSDLAVSAENPQSAIENEPVTRIDTKSNNGFVYAESKTSISSNKEDPDDRQLEVGIIDKEDEVAENPESENSLARSSVINFNESSEDSIPDDETLEQRLVALKDDCEVTEKRTLRTVIRTPKCPVDPEMPTQYQLAFSDAQKYEYFEINAEQFEHDAHIRFSKSCETKNPGSFENPGERYNLIIILCGWPSGPNSFKTALGFNGKSYMVEHNAVDWHKWRTRIKVELTDNKCQVCANDEILMTINDDKIRKDELRFMTVGTAWGGSGRLFIEGRTYHDLVDSGVNDDQDFDRINQAHLVKTSLDNEGRESIDKKDEISLYNESTDQVEEEQDLDEAVAYEHQATFSSENDESDLELERNLELRQTTEDLPKLPVDNGLPIQGSSSEMNELYLMCLELHNEYRAKHIDTGSLTFSAECCETAQAWADNGVYKHSTQDFRRGFGENIAFGGRTKREAVERAIRSMYDEIEDYSYKNPQYIPPGKQVGHFTQIVWKRSRQMGLGVARIHYNGYDGWFSVYHFSPAGNMTVRGDENYEFHRNVLPLIGSNFTPFVEISDEEARQLALKLHNKKRGSKIAELCLERCTSAQRLADTGVYGGSHNNGWNLRYAEMYHCQSGSKRYAIEKTIQKVNARSHLGVGVGRTTYQGFEMWFVVYHYT